MFVLQQKVEKQIDSGIQLSSELPVLQKNNNTENIQDLKLIIPKIDGRNSLWLYLRIPTEQKSQIYTKVKIFMSEDRLWRGDYMNNKSNNKITEKLTQVSRMAQCLSSLTHNKSCCTAVADSSSRFRLHLFFPLLPLGTKNTWHA